MDIDPNLQPDSTDHPSIVETILKPEGNPATLVGSKPRFHRFRRSTFLWSLALLLVYGIGLASGYGLWGRESPEEAAMHRKQNELAKIAEQVNPSEGYTVPVRFGDLGPKMAAAGVFAISDLEQVYQQAKQPLTAEQQAILSQGSQAQVVFNRQNAYFLLNFFWAVGLSNQNPILDSGPIQTAGQGGVENFASTGGWSLAKKPLGQIFSKLALIPLTGQQQKLLEAVASSIYRPCCDNPTHFPDCNHGMAMLGLLELMASQNASSGEMLQAARYANAFWYPQQTLEQAIFFKNMNGSDYKDIDATLLLGPRYSSGSGFGSIHQYLSQNNLLPQAPQNGNSCGV